MPIPGSVLGSKFPFGISAARIVYDSLATLRPVTITTDTTGQDIKTFSDSETYVDIPCRFSPLILIRPQVQEFDRVGVQQFDAKFQVNLNTFIDIAVEVLSTYQVSVDGRVYQIKSVESDGTSLTTRLMVTDQIPFES